MTIYFLTNRYVCTNIAKKISKVHPTTIHIQPIEIAVINNINEITREERSNVFVMTIVLMVRNNAINKIAELIVTVTSRLTKIPYAAAMMNNGIQLFLPSR